MELVRTAFPTYFLSRSPDERWEDIAVLKGISPVLGAEALWVLAAMGHGDDLALVDRNFPAAEVASRTVTGRLVRLDGVDATAAARAIFSLLPVDGFVDDPIRRMEVVGEPDTVLEVHREVLAEARRRGGTGPSARIDRAPRVLRRRAPGVRGHPDHREPTLRLLSHPQGGRLRLRRRSPAARSIRLKPRGAKPGHLPTAGRGVGWRPSPCRKHQDLRLTGVSHTILVPASLDEGEAVLKTLEVKNFTAFPEARLDFAEGLNVIVGENGTGKTHLLKIPYAVMAVSAEEGRKQNGRRPTRAFLQTRIAEKLVNVFRPEDRLGRLARRHRGRSRCEVKLRFSEPGTCVELNFAPQNRSEVGIDRSPSAWCEHAPVFLPTRELLTVYPGFVSLYETHHLEFDETWRDTCLLLGSPTVKGVHESTADRLRKPLEERIGGRIVLERKERFYLRPFGAGPASDMEMTLVAEGWRKLAMLARLVATGALPDKACLFWDKPESNLNPKLIREVAKAILTICAAGGPSDSWRRTASFS